MCPRNILLLYKMSAFQYYQDVPDDCRPDFHKVNRFRETHEVHYETLTHIENVLKDRNLTYQKVERGRIDDYSEFDLIITVGGDGTFLEGARYIQDQLILGVNSDPKWSVGRLCLATRETFQDFLDGILSDEFETLLLNRMKADFKKSGQMIYFLNDILVAHANPASLSRYILSVDGQCEEQRGSGIWFSTAAGSTGAIHSAGGSILDLASGDFQYMPRELYRGWDHEDYQFLGGVFSGEVDVKVISLMAEGMVFVDGSHQRISFIVSEEVVISRAEAPLRLAQKRLSS